MPTTENNYSDALPIGTELDKRFKILETIGRGGFSFIYKVEQIEDGEVYAIKEYFNETAIKRDEHDHKTVSVRENQMEKFESDKKHFLRELSIVRDIGEDKYIIDIYEHFEENGTVYILMELIDGETLCEAVRKGGKWEPKDVISRFKPLMLTMEKIHDKGYLHLDLSPDNIMVRKDGSLCILDFGSAGRITTEETKQIMVEKRHFSALELRDGSGQIGKHSDVFALCSTMYYAMTGSPPRDAHSRSLVKEREKPEPLSKFGTEIDEAAERILMKGMELRVEDRTHDMKNLYQEFEKIYPTLTPEQERRRKIRKRLVIIAGIAAAALFAGIIGYFAWYNRNRIRLGIIASLKTTVSGEGLTDPEFEKTLDTVEDRFGALADKNSYVMQERKDKTAVFEVAQYGYKKVDPDWVTKYLICRPLNIFLYKDAGGTGEDAPIGQLFQKGDVKEAASEEGGIRIKLNTSAVQKFKGALGGGQKLVLGFDTDRYEDSLKLKAYADPDGSILIYRDEAHPVPDSLLVHVFTHAPAPSALKYECEKAVNWEEPSASLMAGKNQAGEKDIPGITTIIYYKSPDYDPKKRGEELQFQYILKNRLDSLRIPYAIGKEEFEGELYAVKVTSGAIWYEEIMTLGKVLDLMLGDENGAADISLAGSEVEKDPGTGPGIIVTLDDPAKEECSKLLDRMKDSGEESVFLYLADDLYESKFACCGINAASDAVRKEGRFCFDRLLFDESAGITVNMADIWCDYVVAAMTENPISDYSVYDIQTMDKTGAPVIEDTKSGPERLFTDLN